MALLAFLLVLVIGGSHTLLGELNALTERTSLEESRKTTEALATAKAALIGYAVSASLIPPGSCATNLSRCPRPGDLPCPDLNNDGYAENSPPSGIPNSCGSASGSNQAQRLARLPWRTLGLPDLRDGNGERLWYAVSNNFKERDRTTCSSPSSPNCLNSDSRGTITVKVAGADTDGDGDPDGWNQIHQGNDPSGAIAVILAPGEPINLQSRGSTCRTSSTTACARNYLDLGLGEDNANFSDFSATNGFIQGEILSNCANGDCNVAVNDRLAVITYQDLMPLLEKRVVGEALVCLRAYAGFHGGRVPWAASVKDVSCITPPNTPDNCYSDNYSPAPDRFGRLPDHPFAQTKTDASDMSDSWLTGCLLRQPSGVSARWWRNWKELIFYGLAEAYRPQPLPLPADAPGPCGDPPDACLTIDSQPSRQVVVIAAGKRLPAIPEVPDPVAPPQPPPPAPYDQVRSPAAQKTAIRNYLEGDNATPDGPLPPLPPPLPPYRFFVSGPARGTFNDFVGYLPRP